MWLNLWFVGIQTLKGKHKVYLKQWHIYVLMYIYVWIIICHYANMRMLTWSPKQKHRLQLGSYMSIGSPHQLAIVWLYLPMTDVITITSGVSEILSWKGKLGCLQKIFYICFPACRWGIPCSLLERKPLWVTSGLGSSWTLESLEL